MSENTKTGESEKKVQLVIKNYPVGDFLIQLKNSALASRKYVSVNSTKLVKAVAETLKKMGYLTEVNQQGGTLNVTLAFQNKTAILTDVILVSKPSRRVYMGSDEIGQIKSPYLMILTTTSGIMSSKDAIKEKLGGEVIAKIL